MEGRGALVSLSYRGVMGRSLGKAVASVAGTGLSPGTFKPKQKGADSQEGPLNGLGPSMFLASFLFSFLSCLAYPFFLAFDITTFAWWGAPPSKQVSVEMDSPGIWEEWRPGVTTLPEQLP